MPKTHESQNELENWLTLLMNTYSHRPSRALAKIICYYIERILCQFSDDITPQQSCHYYSMQRYWRWQSHKS